MKQTLQILLFLFVAGITDYAGAQSFQPPQKSEDPLLVHEGLINARLEMIKKLINRYQYREAIDELMQLKTEVPRSTSLFLDYYLGLTCVYIGDSLKNNIMDVNKYDELVYRDEVDVVYHTVSERELIKKVIKAKGAYYNESEIQELQRMAENAVTSADREDVSEDTTKAVKESEDLQNTNLTNSAGGVSNLPPVNDDVVKEKTDLVLEKAAAPEDGGKTLKNRLKSRKIKYYYHRAITFFNSLIQKNMNNPYREKAMIKKAQTFEKLGENLLAVAEYDLFVRFFPDSSRIVEVLMAKARVYEGMEKNKDALLIYEMILDVYPETEHRNYISLKIEYLEMLLKSGHDDDKNEYMRQKLEILEGFEREIRKKEERLKELSVER